MSKQVNLFVAIRRTKENPNLREHCIRHIIRDYEKDLEFIKFICSKNEGIYRIYKTVNSRDVSKAWKELQHKAIENDNIADRLESEWKTTLLQPKCKAEDKLLIDIDSNDEEFKDVIVGKFDGKDIVDVVKSPNGYHLIVNRVDTRCLEGVVNVEIKKDALVFVEFAESLKGGINESNNINWTTNVR